MATKGLKAESLSVNDVESRFKWADLIALITVLVERLSDQTGSPEHIITEQELVRIAESNPTLLAVQLPHVRSWKLILEGYEPQEVEEPVLKVRSAGTRPGRRRGLAK